MSIESITARIRNEAETYSEDQKAKAEEVKNAGLEDARREAKELKAAKKKNAEEDSKLLKARRESVADLEARKMQLSAKQELIEESFDEALNKLLSLSPDEYIKFVKDQLKEFEGEAGEVLLNSADKEKHGKALEKELKGTSLTLGDETANIKGGFILRRGNITFNASLEKLLENEKIEMTSEIAGMLFPAK